MQRLGMRGALAVGLTGGLVLIGWYAGVRELATVLPGYLSFGVPALVLSTTILGAMVTWLAVRLRDLDRQRLDAVQALAETNRNLETTVTERMRELARRQGFLDATERQQIARDVEAARDQAVEASRLKSAFLATMSHEIRTPMNGVIGLVGLLLNGDLEDNQRRYAEGIRTAGNALLAVISDILDFSKIEAGALILDDAAVNLSSLLENVVDLVTESARSKGLELIGYCDPDLPTLVRGDPVRIRQILLNLASNAVKFTDDGEVFLHIRRGDEPSRDVADPVGGTDVVEVRFEVVDTGIGIEPADRARLFDAFAQADASTTRKFGGTGLGLAISRELAEAMGGHVGVESQPGTGSTFWCSIPLRNEPAGQEAPTALDTSLAGLRVLVVDDNGTNRLILSQQLSSWDMLPTAVASGEEALDHLSGPSASGPSYDLGIVDMDMPGINGVELARRIGARRGVPPLPLILVTSGDSAESGAALERGIVACLSKPFPQAQLRDCLVRVAAGNPNPTAARPASTAAPVSEPPTLGSLLLVEDNEINQLVAVGIVTRLGYGVDIASDGVQALDMVARTTYQAVLMDCQMPNMDGYEATDELRRREGLAEDPDHSGGATLPRLPIIAMTAAALKEDRDRCLAAGMDDYLSKPIQPDELAAALIRWTTGTTPAAPKVTTEEARSTEQSIATRLDDLRGSVSEGLVSRLVTSFLMRAPAYLGELSDAVHRGEGDVLARAAHSLKGVASNLGANSLAATSGELEYLGRDGELQSAPDLLKRMHLEYDTVRRILQDLTVPSRRVEFETQ